MSYTPKKSSNLRSSSSNASPNERNVIHKSMTPTLAGTSQTKSEFLSLAESPSQDNDSCAGNLFHDPKPTLSDSIYSSIQTHHEPGVIEKEAQNVFLKEIPVVKSEDTEKTVLAKESILNCKNWTNEDDQLLKDLTSKFKTDWKKISKKFKAQKKKVTCYFLRTRFKELAGDPYLLRRKFVHSEDVAIARYFNEYGTDWETIASKFTNRTGIMIKNRFYSHIKKKNLYEGLLQESQQNENENLNIPQQHDDDNFPKENSKPIERNLQMVGSNEMNLSRAFPPAHHHSMMPEPTSNTNFQERQGDPLDFHTITNIDLEEEKSTANEQDELDNTSDGERKNIEIETELNVNRNPNPVEEQHREERGRQTESNTWVDDENFLLKLFFK